MVSAETILENASNLINEEGLGMAKRGRPAKVLITKVAKTIRNKRPQTTAENIAAAVLLCCSFRSHYYDFKLELIRKDKFYFV